MRSFNTLLVSTLSFVSLVASGPLHPNPHSSRLVANPISSRQFHHPRALVDVCADLRVIALPINIASLLDVTCLCLSAFPLGLDLSQLTALGMTEAGVEVDLQSLVKDHGSQCTYPDHASPQCTFGNVCDFTCMDGFAKNGGSCVCPSPNSLCNGKCGFHPNGCSSALPSAPKMRRRSIAPSRRRVASGFVSRDSQALDTNVDLDPDCSDPPSGPSTLDLLSITSDDLGIDVGAVVDQVLGGLKITLPVSLGTLSTNLDANLNLCLGSGISQTQGLINTITKVVEQLLPSIFGVTVNVGVNLTCSAPANPNAMLAGLQLCGLVDDSVEPIVDSALNGVAKILDTALPTVTNTFDLLMGGSGCPATSVASPSTPAAIPRPSVTSPPSLTLNTTGLVGRILAELGLGSVNYTLGATTNLTVGVSLALSDTLAGVDELVSKILALIDETLNLLLDLAVQVNLESTPSIQAGDMVVGLDMSSLLNGTLSDANDIVNVVLLAVSEVVFQLGYPVTVNVDGGSSCGCSGSRGASPKN